MPLVERAAATVLSAQPHWDARPYQTAEGQSFGHSVVHGALARAHFGALFEQFLDLWMDMKIFRVSGERLGNFTQFFRRQSGLDLIFRLVAAARVVVPVRWQVAKRRF